MDSAINFAGPLVVQTFPSFEILFCSQFYFNFPNSCIHYLSLRGRELQIKLARNFPAPPPIKNNHNVGKGYAL